MNWGGGDSENTKCQKGDWVRKERWLSYQQAVSTHAEYLEGDDFDILDLDIEPLGGYHKGTEFWDRDASHTKKMMYTYGADEGFREAFHDTDIKNHAGRQRLFQMYNHVFHRYGDKYGTNYSD